MNLIIKINIKHKIQMLIIKIIMKLNKVKIKLNKPMVKNY